MMIIQSKTVFCATQNAKQATITTVKDRCVGPNVLLEQQILAFHVKKIPMAEELVNH
jgi:hypothetical protein